MINCINLDNFKHNDMEKTKMKAITVWRVGIQSGKEAGYGWAWSPEFKSIDEIWATYKDWFVAHPMRHIQFRTETKYVPA